MKKRIFALFLSALLLTTVLCACGDEKSEEAGGIGSNGTSSSGEPVTGGALVVGISQDLGDSLDPYQMTAAGTREVLFLSLIHICSPTLNGTVRLSSTRVLSMAAPSQRAAVTAVVGRILPMILWKRPSWTGTAAR